MERTATITKTDGQTTKLKLKGADIKQIAAQIKANYPIAESEIRHKSDRPGTEVVFWGRVGNSKDLHHIVING